MNRIGMAHKTQSWLTSSLLIILAVGIGWIMSTTIPEKEVENSTGEVTLIEEAVEEALMDSHEPIDVTSELLIPTLTIVATEDPKAGWNLELQTTNFTFTPELASQDAILNEGHAHLYIDGEKITRLYGPWYYLGEFEEGEYLVSVDLNANDHSPFAVSGLTIRDEVLIHVEPNTQETHAHDSADAHTEDSVEEN